MAKVDVHRSLRRIGDLVKSIDALVPPGDPRCVNLRADLAGLLTVYVVATYENCVKETLVSYAYRQSNAFGQFAANQFERLNSRIRVGHLKKYASTFSQAIRQEFDDLLLSKKSRMQYFTHQDMNSRYEMLLDWRHEYAHTGRKNTTIEEAWKTHRIAKHVIYSFDQAFNGS